MADSTTSNAADGTGLTKERLDSLKEAEECLSGLTQPIADALKFCDDARRLVYPDPPDRFDIWTEMDQVVVTLKDIHGYCDQSLPHDEEYSWRSLPGRVRLLGQTRSQTSSAGTNASGLTKEEEERLKEADRCLDGLVKPIHAAFKLAQGSTHYEPDGPEGGFGFWDIMKYIVDQLDAISKSCEKDALTNKALKAASLADRVNVLIAINKSRDGYLKDFEQCLKLLQPEITKAHTLLDGSGTLHGDPEQTEDPDVLSEMRYVVNAIELVDEACNKHKVETYRGVKWEGLSLDYRVTAIADSRELVNVANGTKTDDEAGLSKLVIDALTLMNVDATERQQSAHDQMRKITKDLERIKNDLDSAGVASPTWHEVSLADKVHYLVDHSSANARPYDEDFVDHMRGIFTKLYAEIDNIKDQEFRKGIIDFLAKVLPNNEAATKRQNPDDNLIDEEA